MRYALSATLALIFVLVGSQVLSAQTIRSPYRFVEERQAVGFYGGRLQTDPGRLEMGAQPATIFGMRYDIRLTGPLSGEVVVASGSTTRRVYHAPADGSQSPPQLAGEAAVRLFLAEAGFRFHLTGPRTWRGLAPYAVGTIGVADDWASASAVEASVTEDDRFNFGPAFAVGLGLGSDIYVTERLSLRVDARDHLWRLKYPARFVQTGSSDTEWRHNYALTFGVSLHF